MRIVGHILLVLGAGTIIGSALYMLTHFTDRTAYTVLLPGAVVGLLLIVISTRLGQRKSGPDGPLGTS